MDKEIKKLTEIIELSNDEVGETIDSLLLLYSHSAHLENAFVRTLETEIKSWYEWANTLTIIEHERTETYIVREIEY